MALFNDIYCKICDRFLTKEQWNKHRFSSRHLHREVNGYWPAYFPQRKLTRDKGSILEKTFWEMIYGSEDVLPVYGFLKTYIMMVTNMKDYVTLDPIDFDADFRYDYRDTMIAQFEQDLYNKNFSLQGKGDQIDTLQNRIAFWLNINNMGSPIPDNLFDYVYDDEGLDGSVHGAEIFPEIREFEKLLDILRYKWLRKQLKLL